tara:strand:+ start:7760 stop:8113 length:354 start_codon:yes stop_codon:yes gene_type:complete
MNKTKQRIAIAEAVGWKWVEAAGGDFTWERPDGSCLMIRWWCNKDEHNAFDPTPDYLNDLNACHEMEMSLNKHLRYEFRRTLSSADNSGPSELLCHATAAQRCEAFLKTLDLWEEEA